MIKQTYYHPSWQNSRINFILSKYPEGFFKGKRILELGAHNGYIGACFATLGAIVHCVEGRQENVDKIKWDRWYFFPAGTVEIKETLVPRGFYQWAVESKYSVGPDMHPLEDAHHAAYNLMKDKFNELVTKSI
jgi:hypothetical protein